MKKSLIIAVCLGLILTLSCKKDEEKVPSIDLSQNSIQVKTGNSIEVTVNVVNIAELGKVVITKKGDGTSLSTSEVLQSAITGTSFVFTYDVVATDADYTAVVFTFTPYDNGMNAVTANETELVLTIELGPKDLLMRYDWLYLSEDITPSFPNVNSLGEKRRDDLYRYNVDKSWDVDFGDLNDDFDGWTGFCSWKLDDTDPDNMVLYRNTFGIFTPDVTVIDTFAITKLTVDDLWYVWHEDLSAFGGTADETIVSKFASRPKSTEFVPYRGVTEPTGTCSEIE
jgi:hypothetical protein